MGLLGIFVYQGRVEGVKEMRWPNLHRRQARRARRGQGGARHLELLPQAEVGLSTDRERALATKAELDRVKLAEAASRTRGRGAAPG